MNLMKSAIELFPKNCSGEPLSAINTCCLDNTLDLSFGYPKFRSKTGNNRGVEEGQSEAVVEQFVGKEEDEGGIEERRERELCTIALCNPAKPAKLRILEKI